MRTLFASLSIASLMFALTMLAAPIAEANCQPVIINESANVLIQTGGIGEHNVPVIGAQIDANVDQTEFWIEFFDDQGDCPNEAIGINVQWWPHPDGNYARCETAQVPGTLLPHCLPPLKTSANTDFNLVGIRDSNAFQVTWDETLQGNRWRVFGKRDGDEWALPPEPIWFGSTIIGWQPGWTGGALLFQFYDANENPVGSRIDVRFAMRCTTAPSAGCQAPGF